MSGTITKNNNSPALPCCQFCVHQPCAKLRFGAVHGGKFIVVHRSQFSSARTACPFLEKNESALRRIFTTLSAHRLSLITRQTISLLSTAEKNQVGTALLDLSPDDTAGHIRLVSTLALKGICSVIRIPLRFDQDQKLRRWLLVYQIAPQKKAESQPVAIEEAAEPVQRAAATVTLRPAIVLTSWEHAREKPMQLRKAVATFADSLILHATTKNIEEGTYVYFDVYEGDPKSAKIVQTVDGVVKNNCASAVYSVPKDAPPTTKINICIDDMAEGSDTILVRDENKETLADATCDSATKNDSSTIVIVDSVPQGKPLDLAMQIGNDTVTVLAGMVVGKPVVPVMPVITFIARTENLNSPRRPIPLKTPHEAAVIEAAALTEATSSTDRTSQTDSSAKSSAATATTAVKAPQLTACAWSFDEGSPRLLVVGDALMLSCTARNFNDGDMVTFDVVDESDAGKRIVASLSAPVKGSAVSAPWIFGTTNKARSVKIVFADPLTETQRSDDTLSVVCQDGSSYKTALSGAVLSSQGGHEVVITDITALPEKLRCSGAAIEYTVHNALMGLPDGTLPAFSVRAHAGTARTNVCMMKSGSNGSTRAVPENESGTSTADQSGGNEPKAAPVAKEVAAAIEAVALLKTNGISLDPELLEVLKKNKGRALIVSLCADTDAAGDSLCVNASTYQKSMALAGKSPLVFSDIPRSGNLVLKLADTNGYTYSLPLK